MIAEFQGNYRYLSNMWVCKVVFAGVLYNSSETAFQAQRCEIGTDLLKFKNLNGFEAKALSKIVPQRRDWHDVKLRMMYDIVLAKFEQNPHLATRLLATGQRKLVEGNKWHDKYWGVCDGEGENYLGRVLMRVRRELKIVTQTAA